MEIVALYGRVSTADQAAEGYSLGEQESRLRKFAEAHGWIIGACYMDGGFSGAKLERPGIQALIDDAKNHRITKVIVYKLDRLSRSQKDTLYLIEDVFMKNDVDFVSMSETIDTGTPFGIAMIGILSVFAQLERETIKERMSIGKDASIRSGNYRGVTNYPPIGFSGDNGKIVPNEYEQSLVRRIFDLYLEGYTKRQISRIMEESAPIRDKPWECMRVIRILSNPIYIGKQKWKGEIYDCNDIDPVIDMDTWNAVQYRLEKLATGTNNRANSTHKSLLGGLITCGKCGHNYCGIVAHNRSKRYKYYRCAGTHAYKNADGSCRSPHIPMHELDDRIISEIRKLSADRDLIAVRDNSAAMAADRIAAMRHRLSEIAAQQRKLIDLYTMDSIDRTILIERSESLNSERTKIESEIESTSASIRKPTSFIDDLNRFETIFESCTDIMDLYPIIHNLIRSIEITNGDIKINWAL